MASNACSAPPPVSAVIDDLLTTVTCARPVSRSPLLPTATSTAIPVVNLDDEDDEPAIGDLMEDEVTIVADNLSRKPQNENAPVNPSTLSSRSHVPDRSCQPPPMPAALNTAPLSLSLHNPGSPIDLDAHSASPTSLPSPQRSSLPSFKKHSTDEEDVVEITSPNSPSNPITHIRTSSRSSRCAVCQKQASPRPPLQRCKHALCSSCLLNAIVDPAEPGLYPLPVCPVSRCGAPLSRDEATAALAPPFVDSVFLPALADFHRWNDGDENSPSQHSEQADAEDEDAIQPDEDVDSDDPAELVGETRVMFPPFHPIAMLPTLPDDAENTEIKHPPDMLVNDDFSAASAPLWVWDERFPIPNLGDGALGAWVCAACGDSDPQAAAKFVSSSPPPANCGDSPQVSEVVTPDAPLYPHCAYARAIAVSENVHRLAQTRLEGGPNADDDPALTGAAAPKGRKRPRKSTRSSRYKSAAAARGRKRRRVGFAKGTGFAGDTGNEWRGTSTKLLEKTARLDNEAAYWLCRIRCFLLLPADASLASWPSFMRLLVRECRLIPLLASILINESIMDVQERVPLFVSAMRVVHALAESPSLRMLITEALEGGNGRNIAQLVESLSQQAAFLITGAGADNLPPFTTMLVKQIRRCIRVINRNNLIQIAKMKALGETPVNIDDNDDENGISEDGEENEKGICPSGISIGSATGSGSVSGSDKTDPHTHGGRHDPSHTSARARKPSPPLSFEADKRAYLEQMKQHQFKAVPGLAMSSSFRSQAGLNPPCGVLQGKRQRRIAGEVASLFSSLPLSWSSSILLRVDEDCYDFLRACIFGPEDTPYDSGAFIFDIYLPLDYPSVPPKVRLLTTGGGRVRFNPNLYNNGKVCLSLLGTWSGPSWNSASTILQVLVSIQSLILVSDPYFNEPGLESQMGTAQSKPQSMLYNKRVRYNTMWHAIEGNIKHPLAELDDGIRTHFRLKRRYLKHKFNVWFPQAARPPENAKSHEKGILESITAPQLSVDPTLQPLSHPAHYETNGPFLAQSDMFFASFGLGRNFRSPHMKSADLQKVVQALDSIS